MKSRTLVLTSLALFSTLVLFTGLGSRGLNEPDEGRYANVAREMAAGGDVLLPHLNGVPHLQKPPIIYWLTALSFHSFGLDETSARLPVALSAVGTLLVTFAIALRLYGTTTGVASVLVLLASLEFFAISRMLTPDMTLTFWVTLAVYALVRGREGARVWSWIFFVAMGLGFLTKGPLALVIPLVAAAASRRGDATAPLPWGRGVIVTVAISLSWFLLMVAREPSLAGYFAGYELVDRFGSSIHGRSQPLWFYGPVLMAALLPWSPAVIVAAAAAIPRLPRLARAPRRTRLLVGWAVPPLILLSLSGSKLLTYVLPLLPPVAMLFARSYLRGGRPTRWGEGVVLVLLAVLSVGALESHRWWPELRLERFAPGFAIVLLGALAAVLLSVAGRPPLHRLAVTAVAAGIGWNVVAATVADVNDLLGVQPSVRELALHAQSADDFGSATLFVVGARLQGWGFYTEREFVCTVADADVVLEPGVDERNRLLPDVVSSPERLARRRPAYGLVRSTHFERYFPGREWVALDSAGAILLVASRDAALAKRVR